MAAKNTHERLNDEAILALACEEFDQDAVIAPHHRDRFDGRADGPPGRTRLHPVGAGRVGIGAATNSRDIFMTSKTRLISLALCPLLFAACGSEQGGAEQNDSVHQVNAIIPTFDLWWLNSGCDPSQASKIHGALDLVMDAIGSEGYLACLAEAVPSENNGETVKDIISRLREDRATAVHCEPAECEHEGPDECPPIGLINGELSVRSAFVNDTSLTKLAGTLVRHVTHNGGYDHSAPGEGRLGVDDRVRMVQHVEQCMATERPWGLHRSKAPVDRERASPRRQERTPSELSRPGNAVVLEIKVDSYANVSSLQLNDDGGSSARAGDLGS